ncbi:helix-turn-helix domain-containing protein [Leucobacter sp. M11]|uniref:helix-turn-helix domain-containing protein n=1 Tax=Leucobacter sp. M11 TaxID=2993565 RepID=UPI002D809551|nr:helix-turn-helix domain-containing protein [Leucobacter sp. M11]MEB4613764.1 helix-turn-helix domain containing protein [Leucobacter sp. M11]
MLPVPPISRPAPPISRPAPNGAALASREDARSRALAMSAEGISKRQIASELGVHPTTVGRWLNAPDRRQDGDSHD